MPIIVRLPNGSTARFPDGTSYEDIRARIDALDDQPTGKPDFGNGLMGIEAQSTRPPTSFETLFSAETRDALERGAVRRPPDAAAAPIGSMLPKSPLSRELRPATISEAFPSVVDSMVPSVADTFSPGNVAKRYAEIAKRSGVPESVARGQSYDAMADVVLRDIVEQGDAANRADNFIPKQGHLNAAGRSAARGAIELRSVPANITDTFAIEEMQKVIDAGVGGSYMSAATSNNPMVDEYTPGAYITVTKDMYAQAKRGLFQSGVILAERAKETEKAKAPYAMDTESQERVKRMQAGGWGDVAAGLAESPVGLMSDFMPESFVQFGPALIAGAATRNPYVGAAVAGANS